MDDEQATVLWVFETTHHALWAEEVARSAGLAVELVPAPPAAAARCQLALAAWAEEADAVETALRRAGVPARRYIPAR